METLLFSYTNFNLSGLERTIVGWKHNFQHCLFFLIKSLERTIVGWKLYKLLFFFLGNSQFGKNYSRMETCDNNNYHHQ